MQIKPTCINRWLWLLPHTSNIPEVCDKSISNTPIRLDNTGPFQNCAYDKNVQNVYALGLIMYWDNKNVLKMNYAVYKSCKFTSTCALFILLLSVMEKSRESCKA